MQQVQKKENQILSIFFKVLPEDFHIRQKKLFEASNKSKKVIQSSTLTSERRLNLKQREIYEKLKNVSNNENQFEDSINILLQSLAPKYEIGDELQRIEGIEKITFDQNQSFTKEDISYEVEQGIVTLILIWVSHSPYNQQITETNQKLSQKNPNWKGKFKNVAMSVDEETEDVAKKIIQNNYLSVEHYRFLQEFNNDFLKFLSITGAPNIIITNQQGKIIFNGHPAMINIEETINNEINSKQERKTSETEKLKQKQNDFELLQKAEFQQLKQKLNNLQMALNDIAFEGTISITLKKISIWKHPLVKEVQGRSKLILNYDVNISEKEKIIKFLETYWHPIPESFRHLKEGKIRDHLKLQTEIKTKFQEVFTSLGVDIKYQEQEINNIKYNTEKHLFLKETQNSFDVSATNMSGDIYIQGMKHLEEYLKQVEELESSTVKTIKEGLEKYITVGVGKKFETIRNYKKWGTDEYSEINHIIGQILIIDYWATWCGPCIKEIGRNTRLFKKNQQKWGKNVRAISLCLQLAEEAKDFMIDHEEYQEFIEFYNPKEEEQVDQQKYMVQFIPHYVIVDKFGFIRNISHVEKVEQIINDLLNEQEEITQPQQLGQIDKEYLNKINNVLNNADTQASFAILDPLKIIETEITMIQQAESDLQIPKLYYFARDYQEEKLKVILSKLFDIIPEQNWNIQKIISKTLKIPYPGLICSVCKKDIANEAQQYYSPFKSEYVCTICAEFEEKQKKGVEKYKYHDTLIFINGPLSDSNVLIIDDYKIGTNIQLNKGEEGSQLHFVKCYGCSKKPRGPRYISATARPGKYKKGYIDFCHECFLLLKDKNSEKAKEIVAMNAKEGMILDSLFTRVLFYFGDQQDF